MGKSTSAFHRKIQVKYIGIEDKVAHDCFLIVLLCDT